MNTYQIYMYSVDFLWIGATAHNRTQSTRQQVYRLSQLKTASGLVMQC